MLIVAKAAMSHFLTELIPATSSASKRIASLWREYEDGETREAKFVKDLDRFELGLQGVEYERGESLFCDSLIASEKLTSRRSRLSTSTVL